MSALSSSAAENCGSATPKCWQSKLKRNVKMSSTVSFYCKVRHIATMKNIPVQQLTLILIYILYLLWTLRGDLRFDSALKIRLCQVNHIRLCDLTIRQSYFCLVRRTQNSFALAMGAVCNFSSRAVGYGISLYFFSRAAALVSRVSRLRYSTRARVHSPH